MSVLKQFDLLVDITRLLKKYGPDEFDDLAKALQKPETLEHLIAIIQASSHASRKAGSLKGKKGYSTGKKVSAGKFFRDLENVQSAKARILANFHDDLMAKNALPSLRDIRALAVDKGLEPVRAKSRDKAILPLLKDLANRPIEDIQAIFEGVKFRSQNGDRTLQGWTDVILDNKRRNKQ